MPLFVAVPANDVGVPGTVGASLVVVAGQAIGSFWLKAVVVSPDGGNLLNLLVGQVLPDDLPGFLRRKFGLDSIDPVQSFVIILDHLQVAGGLGALIEGHLTGPQDLVTYAVL
jgi:hypothetical protein